MKITIGAIKTIKVILLALLLFALPVTAGQAGSYISLQQPTVDITGARMVSSEDIGIAINVLFPDNSAGSKRFIKFNATISSKTVEKIFDITKLTTPEKENSIGVTENGKLSPKTPLKINLKKMKIKRFTKNEKFGLTAVAYSDDGNYSEESAKEVEILLPVVIVHGILQEFAFTQPINALAELKKYLIDNGYEKEQGRYQTVYYLNYKSFWSCKRDARMLANKVKQSVLKKTYAAKVNIVAHSMGGLISRYSIAEDKLPVDKLIMIGTPNRGSTFAFTALIDYAGLLGRYITPLRQLMPVYDYLYDFSGKLDKNLQKRFGNRFIKELNSKPLSNSVKYFSIFNSAFQTQKEINVIYDKPENAHYEVKSYGNGDNTVLAESAQLDGAENIDVSDASETGKHMFLPANSGVLSKIKEILSNE